MEVLSLPCVAGQWGFEEPIAKGAFLFWMWASCWFSLYTSIMIHNNFCFSCRSQMMPPRSSRLFFCFCCMLYVFCVRTICTAECSGKDWSGAEVGVLHFRLFPWIIVVFVFFILIEFFLFAWLMRHRLWPNLWSLQLMTQKLQQTGSGT